MLRHYQALPNNNPHSRINAIAYLGSDFKDYLEHVPKKLLWQQLFTFSNKFDIDEALSQVEKMSFIYFLETFKNDIRDLFRILDLNEPNFHRDMQSQHEFFPTDDERSQLRDLMEPEYQLLEQVKQIKLSRQ